MTDIASRIVGLSPEKRALLARIVRQTPQRRLWSLDRMNPASAVCNVPTTVRVPHTRFAGIPRS
jgi:hypothetical protein